jgi:hypothetical protein
VAKAQDTQTIFIYIIAEIKAYICNGLENLSTLTIMPMRSGKPIDIKVFWTNYPFTRYVRFVVKYSWQRPFMLRRHPDIYKGRLNL